ncbi:MAG: hypothetical protein H3C34_14910, partial [Caldilineaceae bacterium]|nr:hypothetical protein [Caldilineaceae bacterium]
QMSLWNQSGSSVIRGNLLVIPIGDSLLYVEPLYLQAQSGKIPELKRVILATADRVVMAENLGAALVSLFGRDSVDAAGLTDLLAFAPPSQLGGGSIETSAPAPAAAPTPAAAADLTTASVADLIVRANDHYNLAQDYLRAGNWAAYGAEMDALQATLNQLVQLTGGITPTATPEPSASQ